MRKGILGFMEVATLFDNPEGGGGGVEVIRPDSISADEWEGLSQEEREGVLMTGEGEQGELVDDGEVSDDELTEEELAIIADTKKEDEPVVPAVVPDEPVVAAGEVPVVAVVSEPIPDEQLLQFRAVVKDSELPISTDVPTELSAKLDALDGQFDEGEIPTKEYQAARDAINREIVIHQLGSRDEARADKVWDKEQAFFLNSRPDYLEKSLQGNVMFGALGEAVKAVSNDPKFANASGMAILVEADKAVRAMFKGTKAPAPAAVVKPATIPAVTRPDAKTLATVPTAVGNDTNGDPFAPIDRLTGDAFEKALERLTPEQRAEYERRA